MKNNKCILPLILAVISLIGFGFLFVSSMESVCVENKTIIDGCTTTLSIARQLTTDLKECIRLSYENDTDSRWEDYGSIRVYHPERKFKWVTQEICVRRKLKFRWDD